MKTTSLPIQASGGKPTVTPTDITNYIRHEQCRRYLRLQLHTRNGGSRFWKENGIVPQPIAPLLSTAGAQFESDIESALGQTYSYEDFGGKSADSRRREPDNEKVLREIGNLAGGQARVLLQPRLSVAIGEWQLRGDLDLLRLERGADGVLRVLIADMKRSTAARNEHRLQLAFYHRMLETMLEEAGVTGYEIATGVLYRGIEGEEVAQLSPEELAERERQINAAKKYFGDVPGLLEITDDPEAFLAEVENLVLAPASRAAEISSQPFEEIPFHLSTKCDGCRFSEFCMKWAAQHDDLSLLPYLSASEKSALQKRGVVSMTQLAHLKELAPDRSLQTPPQNKELVESLGATWPVGPRLDELIHRARRYRRFKGDDVEYSAHIPSKGYGSLPYCDAEQNPNLIRIYLDAQYDYLHDRLYLLGARVAGSENGVVARHETVVELADGAPESADKEAALLLDFCGALLQAVSDVATPDENGELRAPIHLIFWNAQEQTRFLEALGRHSAALFSTPLYDFVTQLAAYDSPIATFLDQEIRELKNYPMLCQSLQDVARYLRFDWNSPLEFRRIFYAGLFDAWRAEGEPESADEKPQWYTSRARFSSSIPLEFAHAAWGVLPPPKSDDPFKPYRLATRENLTVFQARRLEAMEHIAGQFAGNRQTEKTDFDLPDLVNFECKARDLATALQEFVAIERHVELGAWKTARLAPPERRVLAGDTLIVRYCEADQDEETREANRENARIAPLVAQWREDNPGKRLTAKIREENGWVQKDIEEMRFHLRLECGGCDCDLGQMMGLTNLRENDGVILFPRWTTDSRLPLEEQKTFTPTPKQMLYGLRAKIVKLHYKPGEQQAKVEIQLSGSRFAGKNAPPGFVFPTINDYNVPFEEGKLYTLDADPNDWYGLFCATAVNELEANANELYQRLCDPASAQAHWPDAARQGQQQFLAGLDALGETDDKYTFEPSKREYIGAHGAAPLLLVQGPPGTGKSYATAFALWARMQGALAAGLEWRVFCGCKTHAATDVLLENLRDVQDKLRAIQEQQPALFEQYFDARLLEVPLFRAARTQAMDGVIPLPKKSEQEKGELSAAKQIHAVEHCFVGATPGGVYRVLKDAGQLSGHNFCGAVVLDEASQMNLPEAIMASLALGARGQVIVVGDHRQMPPIVKHNWSIEPRRTFADWKTYASLFETLLEPEMPVPVIRFEESFRLHADLAEFLHQEIYRHDGIHYHSRKTRTLPALEYSDPFVEAVLSPGHPLVVIVHEEAASLLRNDFERDLLAPVLRALSADLKLDAKDGLGVVVPHRAQRAALQEAVPQLRVLDPDTGEVLRSAVDTVERFQGDEREAIVVSATESDAEYLLLSGKFLLDPRRLTVALSRAKQKMILIAARSVFEVFSADEEIFQNAQIWKNLLRRTCTVPLWAGERDGFEVQVWGNAPSAKS